MSEKKAKTDTPVERPDRLPHTQVTSSTNPAHVVDSHHSAFGDAPVTPERPIKPSAPTVSPQEGHPEQPVIPAPAPAVAVPDPVIPTPPPSVTPPVTLDAPLHMVIDAPEPKKPAATAHKVRSLVHLDDTNDTGKSYRPGHIIEGWSQEKVDRLVASGQVELVEE